MGFSQLLGNRQLKENLQQSLQKGRISHFYLISGPLGSGKGKLAKLLSAAILCKSAHRPCLSCSACRKVMAGSHPDFILVDDPEKKTVPVDLIRKARADMYVQPNEADRKIYVLPRAQDMMEPSQNALLKILEEPPAYGVFLLLTDNPEKLLPTVRSRCTELSLTALPPQELTDALRLEFPDASAESLAAAVARSGGFLGQAKTLLAEGSDYPPQTQSFAAAFASRNVLELTMTLSAMEKWKRDQLITALSQWVELLEAALASRSGLKAISPLAEQIAAGRSPGELMRAISHLQKCIEYAQRNVSCAAICGYLAWELR